MDNLSISDEQYDKKYEDMHVRLDKVYERFTDIEKKTFMKSFLADVNIYEEEQTGGRILRSFKFRFFVFFNGKGIYGLDCDNESTA